MAKVQDKPGIFASVTTTDVSVVFPVFWILKLYGTDVPTAPNTVRLLVFKTSIAGANAGPVTVAVAVRSPRVPKSGVPMALAMFVTFWASRSAWVTVYVLVQIALFGISPAFTSIKTVGAQVIAPMILLSETCKLRMGTDPMFVTS